MQPVFTYPRGHLYPVSTSGSSTLLILQLQKAVSPTAPGQRPAGVGIKEDFSPFDVKTVR